MGGTSKGGTTTCAGASVCARELGGSGGVTFSTHQRSPPTNIGEIPRESSQLVVVSQAGPVSAGALVERCEGRTEWINHNVPTTFSPSGEEYANENSLYFPSKSL